MTTPTAVTETLSVPLDGITEAHVRISFGGGVMALGPADPGLLVGGTFTGGVVHRSPAPGRIEIEPLEIGRRLGSMCDTNWDVHLTTEVPLDLRIDSGANQSEIDLTPLRVRNLELHTGASDTTLRLPARGVTHARIECGFAHVTVEVPAGMAARVSGNMGLGKIDVDQSRFPRSGKGWSSPGYEAAPDRVEIEISGGFGAVRVV